MTELKRRTLILSTGKQVRLFGNSMAIGKSLEIGEGAAPNIFSCIEREGEEIAPASKAKDAAEPTTGKEKPVRKTTASISNPYRLTQDELQEIADYNIRLCMDLKDNIRTHGIHDPKVFNQEALR